MILLEDPADLEEAVACLRTSDCSPIIALCPEVMARLETLGLPYCTPEQFTKREELYRIGAANYEKVEELGREVETHFGGELRACGAKSINPIYANFARFKWGCDSFAMRVHELVTILRSENPKRLLYFDHPVRLFQDNTIMGLTGGDNIYSLLLPEVAAALSLQADECSPAGNTKSAGDSDGHYASARCRLPKRLAAGVWRTARQLSPYVRASFHRTMSGGSGKKIGLLWGSSHDLPRISQLLRSSGDCLLMDGEALAGRRVRRLDPSAQVRPENAPATLQRFRSIWQQMKDNLAFRQFFCHEGVFWDGLVADWLDRYFTIGVLEIAQYFEAGERIAKEYRPSFLLTTHCASHRQAAFAQALACSGVPVVFSQEGGNYGYVRHPMNNYADMCLSDYFLAYGPGVVDQLQKLRPTPRQKAIGVPTGSLRLSAVMEEQESSAISAKALRSDSGPLTIMYVPNWFTHSVAYSYTHMDRAYFQMQRRLIDVLAEFPSVRVILKLAESGMKWSAPILDYARTRLPQASVTTVPLTSLLGCPDAFLIDWSSTALLEVLTTRKPILVHMDRIVAQPLPEALALLQRRALVSTEFEVFLKETRSFLSDPKKVVKGVDLANTDFVQAYGTSGQWQDVPARLLAFFSSLEVPSAGSATRVAG